MQLRHDRVPLCLLPVATCHYAVVPVCDDNRGVAAQTVTQCLLMLLQVFKCKRGRVPTSWFCHWVLAMLRYTL